MADFGKWFSNPLTQGLKNEAADAQRKARAAQNEAQRANLRTNDSSDRAIQRSEELLDVKNELVDKNSEIRKLKQKLEETEAQLQEKFGLLKDYVLSQTAWKAIAKQIAEESGIPEDQLQHRVDVVALDYAKSHPDHGFDTTTTYINSTERMNSRQQDPL